MKVKDSVTAEQILGGVKKPKTPGVKIPFFKVKLVKSRSIELAANRITNLDDLVRIAKMELANLPHEEVLAIGLGPRYNIIGVVRVSQGGIGGAAVTAQEIIRPMLAMGASAFVVAHNHPSGDPTPSREDYMMTDKIKKAAACVDLAMLDHIVIGGVRGGGYTEIMNRYATGTFAKDE